MLYSIKSTISGKYNSIFPKHMNPCACDNNIIICSSSNLIVISPAPALTILNTSSLFWHLVLHYPFYQGDANIS